MNSHCSPMSDFTSTSHILKAKPMKAGAVEFLGGRAIYAPETQNHIPNLTAIFTAPMRRARTAEWVLLIVIQVPDEECAPRDSFWSM
jgi:hypothetical protein